MAKRSTQLGFVQQHVLIVLANRGPSAVNDWAAWYPIHDTQVRGAIDRLGRRSLVDVAGFDGRSRIYKITARGLDMIDALCLEAIDG